MGTHSVTPEILHERQLTKRKLNYANVEAAEEARERMKELIAGLERAIGDTTDPGTIRHLEALKTQAEAICQRVEEVIATSRTQTAITDAELREAAGTIPFRRPRPNWRPGGDDVG